jgi:hypothetical protein
MSDTQRTRPWSAAAQNEGGRVVVELHDAAVKALKEKDPQAACERYLSARQLCWEKLHTGPWNDVALVWREAFADLTVSLVTCRVNIYSPEVLASETSGTQRHGKRRMSPAVSPHAKRPRHRTTSETTSDKRPVNSMESKETVVSENSRRCLVACLGWVDQALMMAPPHATPPLHSLADRLHATLAKQQAYPTERWGDEQELTHSAVEEVKGSNSGGRRGAGGGQQAPTAVEVKRIPPPTLIEFMGIMARRQPLVLRGACRQWPGFTKWRDLAYIRRVCGFRSVPVEVSRTCELKHMFLETNKKSNTLTC